jgi:hypothetical protein
MMTGNNTTLDRNHRILENMASSLIVSIPVIQANQSPALDL